MEATKEILTSLGVFFLSLQVVTAFTIFLAFIIAGVRGSYTEWTDRRYRRLSRERYECSKHSNKN